jgi:hypothetical protein
MISDERLLPGVNTQRLLRPVSARGCRAPTGPSLHLRLLRYFESIVAFDAQVSDGTLKFRMTEQQLHYSQVFGPSIDQRRFGAVHRMSTVGARIKADLPNPAVNDSRILSRGQVRRPVDAAREQVVIRTTASALIK